MEKYFSIPSSLDEQQAGSRVFICLVIFAEVICCHISHWNAQNNTILNKEQPDLQEKCAISLKHSKVLENMPNFLANLWKEFLKNSWKFYGAYWPYFQGVMFAGWNQCLEFPSVLWQYWFSERKSKKSTSLPLPKKEVMFLVQSVCLSVCLSVRRITRKLVNGFWRNFLEG